MTQESKTSIDWPAITLHFFFGALFGLIPGLSAWYMLTGVFAHASLALPAIALVTALLAAWQRETFWEYTFMWFAWWV